MEITHENPPYKIASIRGSGAGGDDGPPRPPRPPSIVGIFFGKSMVNKNDKPWIFGKKPIFFVTFQKMMILKYKPISIVGGTQPFLTNPYIIWGPGCVCALQLPPKSAWPICGWFFGGVVGNPNKNKDSKWIQKIKYLMTSSYNTDHTSHTSYPCSCFKYDQKLIPKYMIIHDT